jgi:hypothetical protein
MLELFDDLRVDDVGVAVHEQVAEADRASDLLGELCGQHLVAGERPDRFGVGCWGPEPLGRGDVVGRVVTASIAVTNRYFTWSRVTSSSSTADLGTPAQRRNRTRSSVVRRRSRARRSASTMTVCFGEVRPGALDTWTFIEVDLAGRGLPLDPLGRVEFEQQPAV